MKIGITGHQNLGDRNIVNWLKTQIEIQLKQYEIDEAYSCLAIGAEQ